MDDLLTFVSELSVDTTIPNNTSAPHPRFTGVKSRKPCDQAKRRANLLAEQKRRRADVVDASRGFVETTWSIEEQLAQKRPWQTVAKSNEVVGHTKEYGKKLCLKQNSSKSPHQHKRRLMLSEWLVDVPEDLKEAWYMVPCPEGKRSCVYSSFTKGRVITKAVSRHGYSILDNFKSTLPKSTTLDCIWSAVNGTFYIIDVLEWNGMSILDCETEFRFTWLQGKFKEMEDIFIKSPENSFAFVLLPFYSCSTDIISNVMSRHPMFPNDVPCLDGLLFYHARTHYRAGPTPLVGWLKPNMLPEVLGVVVAEDWMCLTVPTTKQKKSQIMGSKLDKQILHQTMETENLVPAPATESECMVETECTTEVSETVCEVDTIN